MIDVLSVPLLPRLLVPRRLFNELLLLLDGRIDELIRRSKMSNAGLRHIAAVDISEVHLHQQRKLQRARSNVRLGGSTG